jgi:hypothetical protein
MKTSKKINRLGYLLTAASLFVAVLLPSLNAHQASAAQINARKLTVSSSAIGTVTTDIAGNSVAAGSGGNGAKARHTFDVTVPGAASAVQSIEFLYCTTPIPGTTCTAPTGMDASTVATIAGQSGTGLTGFALGTSGNAPTANRIRINRTNATNVSSDTAAQYFFGTGGGTDWIKNPTSTGTFFVRITTFTDNGYATTRDQGSVASSTATQIDVTAKVQEKLKFSVASAYIAPNSTCDNLTGSGAVALGDVDGILDSSTQYDAHSYYRLSTNALNGTIVYYSGDTLKSGTNDINALTSEIATTAGLEQFGLANDSGDTGKYSFAGGATGLSQNANYDEGNGVLGSGTPPKFNYAVGSVTTPVALASSSSVVICDTGSVRYLGNIATTTPAGIYTTTVTYIAVPAF